MPYAFQNKTSHGTKDRTPFHLKLIIQRNNISQAEIVSELNLKKGQVLKFFPLSVYI